MIEDGVSTRAFKLGKKLNSVHSTLANKPERTTSKKNKINVDDSPENPKMILSNNYLSQAENISLLAKRSNNVYYMSKLYEYLQAENQRNYQSSYVSSYFSKLYLDHFFQSFYWYSICKTFPPVPMSEIVSKKVQLGPLKARKFLKFIFSASNENYLN